MERKSEQWSQDMNLFILTQCCEATEFRVWVPMEWRWITRWLNHSAGGNCAENVASAAGGAEEPLCLRPLLLNKRDSNDIFSAIQKAKCGILIPNKYTVPFTGIETRLWIYYWRTPIQNNSMYSNISKQTSNITFLQAKCGKDMCFQWPDDALNLTHTATLTL
jgi:hypothetical protein